jgi:hypothetical protein
VLLIAVASQTALFIPVAAERVFTPDEPSGPHKEAALSRVVCKIMWRDKVDRAGCRPQYSARALCAGYRRLQTHTHNV